MNQFYPKKSQLTGTRWLARHILLASMLALAGINVAHAVPVLSLPADITANNDAGLCGAVVDFSVTATDDSGTPTVSTLPATGSFFDVGDTTVNAVARSSAGDIAQGSFNVTVSDTELPTVVTQDLEIVLDSNGEFTIDARFILDNAFVSRSDNCGMNNGQVNHSGPRDYTCNNLGANAGVVFSFDVNGNQTRSAITYNVTDPLGVCNSAPVLAPIGNQTIDEGQPLEFTVSASDSDTGDTLTFQIGNPPTGATLIDNADGTATFSWTPSFTQAGNYPDVLITVTDNGVPIKADTETFTIVVGDGMPPTWYLEDVQFDSGAFAIGSFVFDADTDTYSNINISISKENTTNTYGDILPLSPGNANFMLTIPVFMSDLTGQPRHSLDFAESLTNAGGTVDISISPFSSQGVCLNPSCSGNSNAEVVTSGKVTTVQPTNTAPILAVIGNQTVDEGQLLEFTVSASDPDTGDTLTIQLGNAPTGATLIDNADGTATFSWTPGFTQAGNFPDVLITVTDNGVPIKADTETFTITVGDVVNSAPTITSSSSANVNESQTSAIDVDTTDDLDSEGAGLTYSLTGTTDDVQFDIDTNTGVVTFITAPDFETPTDTGADNNYNIQVTVTDSGGLTAVQNIVVTVTDVAGDTTAPTANPSLNPRPNRAGWNNSDVTINWNWSDGHGGSGLDANSCTTNSLVNTDGTSGNLTTCTDVVGNSAESQLVTVNLDKSAPDTIITANPPTTSTTGDANFEFTGSDALSGISGFECTLDTGVIAGTSPCTSPQSYTVQANGTYTFTVRAIDVADNVDPTPASYTWTVDVTNPSEPNLLGQWTLDDGIGTIASDTSGNGNDGTVNGAAWTTAGQVDGALDFDGSDDYVGLGNLNASADSLTISAWINADTFTHLSRQDARIVSKATGTASQDHYFMLSTIKSNGATRLRFRLMTNGLTTTLFGSGGVLTSSTWIHVAAVYDGAQMRLYQDGVEVGNTSKTGNIDQNAVAVWIGRNPDGKRPFDGRIDEVYIYDQALTAAEIAALANTGAGGNQAPTAVALGTPTSGDAPLDVDFDGSGSTDSDGIISTYAWDFGDGSAGSNQQNPMHTYTTAGSYTATLTVTDDEAATATATVAITVTDPNNNNVAPTAAAAGTPTSGNAPLDVDFDGSGSTDSDGTISTYAWDFGDGSAGSNLQNPMHTYNAVGNYTATLTVTDDEGATDTDTIAITVTNPSGSGFFVGLWTLDDGSGAIAGDSSGNGNDGVVNGAAWTTAGQVRGALDFDGNDDYVDLGSLNASADSLTISAWINADTFTHLSRQDARIVSKATGTASQDHYFMLSTIKSNGATRLRFRLMTNGATTTLLGSGGVLTSGTWIHVAAVYDGAQMRLYQDGVEVGNTSKTGNIDQNAVAVWIGRNPDGKRPFDGRIDEVYIYDQALTAAEIAALANTGAGGNQAPTAVALGTPTSGDAPLDVDFDGSGSTDSDGIISTYAWDFGDGSAGSNLQNPTHTYIAAGNYTAILTVTDDEGATNTDTVAITVTNPSGSDLIGHWNLNNDGGTIASDSSGNGNDGIVNGAAWTIDGLLNAALDFDGSDDYVDLGSLNASADSLTISAWINADTFTHLSRQDARIVSKATGTGSQDHYFMLSTIKSNGATRLRFRLMTNGSTTTLFGSGGVLTSGTWIHVAAVYDGAQMRLYQDGVEVGNTSKTGNIDQNAVSVWIGRNPDGKRPFDGRIDEVYIYDRALSPAEIQVLTF